LQQHGAQWSLVHPVGGEVATFTIEPSALPGRGTARGWYIPFAPHAKKSKTGSTGSGAKKPGTEPKSSTQSASDNKKSTESTAGTKATPTTDDAALRAEFAKLPDAIKALLGGGTEPAQDLAHLLRIANKLKSLSPQELELFKVLPKQLTSDLDAFEQSVDHFIEFKDKILAQAEAEKAKAAKTKEPTLEEKLADTWKGFDESKFGSMSQTEKEATAREIAAQQRNETLKHMATHPGETAYQMAEGVVRVDKTAKAIAEDVREAADGNANGFARLAGGVGALGKTIAAVAAIVFIVLLFVPGVNLVELAAAGLVVALTTIALASMEAELRIQAASESKTVKEFETQTEKSAQAQVTAISTAALIGVALLMKIIARIPLPGRLQNVGNALRMAKAAIIEKTGVGPVLRQVKVQLLERLRGSKEGLSEAVAAEAKNMQATANLLRGITGEEMLKRIAAGDAALADLGVPPEQANALLEVAKKPGQAGLPEQLRQNFLKALEDAPAEATKRVQQFMKDIDQSVADLEKANTEAEVKGAIDKAEEKLGPEAQAKQAAKTLTGAQQEAELAGKSFKELEEIAREKKYTPEGVQAAETLFYKIKGRLMAALRALRKKIGPKSTSGGTVAVGMTDIEGIGGIEEGRSPKIGGERGGPYETDQPFPSAKGHAERGVLTSIGERIRKALADGTLKREQLKGRTVLIMVDQPVCSSCLSGATGAEVQYLGPLSKFMAEFPELAIEIEEVDTGRHYTTSLPAKK